MASPESLTMLEIAAAAADAKGGEDLVALDVSEPLPLVDVFLLVTGRSERNVAAIADEIEDKLNEAGHKRLRREGRAESRWVLLDFGDLVVHV
ncbi:ribosome silencing factor, partial [Microbacterium sp.]|uniref:ribosome silencing factor n=1 Tax=Microbacterium sp. TaxID=51671 RepID=UPI002812496D